MTAPKRRQARVEAALHPPQSLAALCAKAAARAGLDAPSVEAEARRILAGGENVGEALRRAVADLAAATGRPADEVTNEYRRLAEELIA